MVGDNRETPEMTSFRSKSSVYLVETTGNDVITTGSDRNWWAPIGKVLQVYSERTQLAHIFISLQVNDISSFIICFVTNPQTEKIKIGRQNYVKVARY